MVATTDSYSSEAHVVKGIVTIIADKFKLVN